MVKTVAHPAEGSQMVSAAEDILVRSLPGFTLPHARELPKNMI